VRVCTARGVPEPYSRYSAGGGVAGGGDGTDGEIDALLVEGQREVNVHVRGYMDRAEVELEATVEEEVV
jgi:hypothetical protein